LRVGIDLDNTLIDYDQLFHRVAVERGLVPAGFAGTKRDIRDRIRLLHGGAGELDWQRLQAEVYGPAIAGATPAEGALEFIRRLRMLGATLAIVSHKTTFANMGEQKINLRDAAREWLRANGMLGRDAVPEDSLYFEDTRAAKIAQIVALRCSHFIDDLEEVFDDPAFPKNVERLLLTKSIPSSASGYRCYSSFSQIADALITR
jgi:hypothetical protein